MEQEYLNLPEEKTKQLEGEQTNPPVRFDFHIAIFILQGIICVAILLFFLVTKIFFADFYGEVKKWYNKNLNEDTDISLVLGNSSEVLGKGGPLESIDLDLSKGFSLPVAGKVTSGYGYRTDPFSGESSFHSGVDIAAPKGTFIKSALTGVVELAEKSGGDYGNYVIINHGGIKTLYAHCNELKVAEGQRVSMGDEIATVGSTGRSTGPHLHFEIRVGDAKIDPTHFINIENQ